MYLHSAVDGHTRLAYTESLPNEKAATAIGFVTRAKVWWVFHFERGGGVQHAVWAAVYKSSRRR